jgi:hypothetical protein
MSDELNRLSEGESPAPVLEPAPRLLESDRPGRVHWVVVRTRSPMAGENVPAGTVLVTQFWHPRDHQWNENAFESLDHAIRLFVDESGWVLRQQQALDGPNVYELIFEARREDFSRPSTEQMLEDVGLSPQDVAKLLNRVSQDRPAP